MKKLAFWIFSTAILLSASTTIANQISYHDNLPPSISKNDVSYQDNFPPSSSKFVAYIVTPDPHVDRNRA